MTSTTVLQCSKRTTYYLIIDKISKNLYSLVKHALKHNLYVSDRTRVQGFLCASLSVLRSQLYTRDTVSCVCRALSVDLTAGTSQSLSLSDTHICGCAQSTRTQEAGGRARTQQSRVRVSRRRRRGWRASAGCGAPVLERRVLQACTAGLCHESVARESQPRAATRLSAAR